VVQLSLKDFEMGVLHCLLLSIEVGIEALGLLEGEVHELRTAVGTSQVELNHL
jgi:hypothetical protein